MSGITIIGSNLNTYGDNGDFETAYSGSSWGANFAYLNQYCTITRDTPPPLSGYVGVYACKVLLNVDIFTTLDVTRYAVVQRIASATFTKGRKYLAKCKVISPTSNAVGADGWYIDVRLVRSKGSAATYEVKKTINGTNGSISPKIDDLEIRFTHTDGVGDTSVGYLDLVLEANTDGRWGGNPALRANGYLWVDDIKIYEYTDVVTTYTLSAAITPVSGPNDSSGQLVITVYENGSVSAGSFYYSIGLNGTRQTSNTFSSLTPGTYVIYVWADAVATNPLASNSFTVPKLQPGFTVSLVGQNESSAGAGDGSITATVSYTTGSPFLYSLFDANSGAVLVSNQSSNVFTGLDPGTYRVRVRDTYGNSKSANITLYAGDPICAIAFDPSATQITGSTTATAADGSIQVIASDQVSGGSVWYKLGADFTYPSGDNTTGLFSGLLPGSYTIYARTTTKCVQQLTVTVPVQPPGSPPSGSYETKYRFEFNEIGLSEFKPDGFEINFGANNQFRFDIEMRDYSGSITEVMGSDSPVVLSWNAGGNQNPFTIQLVPSSLEFNVISETDEQFEEFFTTDETLYRGKLYWYNGNEYQLIWCGYSVPMTFSEPYVTKTNYPVSLLFTDRLEDLSDIEFGDINGNEITTRISILEAVRNCLRRIGSDLNIRDKVNTYAPGMELSQGPLRQIFFDPRIYKNSDGTYQDCKTVLESILKGCSLFQSDGIWHIEAVSEKCNLVVQYSEYSISGDLESSGVESNRIFVRKASASGPRVVISEASGMKSIGEMYGSAKITYDLGIEQENNLLEYSDFNAVDIANGQIRGWNVSGLVFPVTATIVKSPGKDGDCLSINFQPGIESDPITLISEPVEVKGTNGVNYKLKLSFDIYTIPISTNTHIFFDYRLYMDTPLGRRYLQHQLNLDTGLPDFLTDTSALLTDGWIRVYVDEHATWKTFSFETVADVVDAGQDIKGPLQVEFRFDNNSLWDVGTQALLEAVTTNNYARKQFDNRRRLPDNVVGTTYISFYKLQPTSEATSFPSVVEPDDFSDAKWIIEKNVAISSVYATAPAGWLQSILIDNVRVGYYPAVDDPVEKITTEITINENTTPIFTDTLLHGDIVDSEIDANYERITQGYFTLANGDAIYGGWFRRGSVTESRYFHDLYAEMVRGQFSLPRWILSGSFDTRQVLISWANIFHEVRNGRVYMPIGTLSIDYKRSSAQFSLRESLRGPAQADTGDVTDVVTIDPVDVPENYFREHDVDQHSNEHA